MRFIGNSIFNCTCEWPLRHTLCFNAIILIACCVTPTFAAEPNIAILYGRGDRYLLHANLVKEHLQKANSCTLMEITDSEEENKALVSELTDGDYKLTVSVGLKPTALALRMNSQTPILFSMVPNILDSPLIEREKPIEQRLAGLATGISPGERMDWINTVCPQAKRIAVLYSSRTEKTVQALEAAASELDKTLVKIKADKDNFPQAIEELNNENIDSVIMIPDAHVYNAATAKRLLLWGIRNKKPVWAFSGKIVKAGALGGQYVEKHSIARQTAELAQRLIEGTPPTEIGLQYPKRINRAVNIHTAEMIDLPVSSEIVGEGTSRFGE